MSEVMDVDEEESDTGNHSELGSRVIQIISPPHATSLIIRVSDHEIPRATTSRFVEDQNIEHDSLGNSATSISTSEDTTPRNVALNELLPADDENDLDSASEALSQQSTISIAPSNEDANSCASPAKRIRLCDNLEEDESQTCPICFDNWTTSGDHRLCALKCGHLFGYRCVKRWVEGEMKKCCPTCKKKVSWNDIRYIYARKVIAMDTTELTITKKELEKVNEEKNKILTELAKATCRIHMLTEEKEEYKKRLEAMTYTKRTLNEPCRSSPEIVSLSEAKTIELGRNSNCRVLDSKAELDMIGVSVKSCSPLYPGFGIKLLNITNFKPTAFVPVHADVIRDIKFHDSKPWLLSCSIDKKAKMFDANTNRIIMSIEGSYPLWSCCWDANYDHNLYVGQQQGSVLKFDIRKPTEPIQAIQVQGDFSPVVSVHSLRHSNVFPFGAVISCKLNSIWAFENTQQEPVRYPLPVEGPFVSMTCHKDNDHLFLSSRPNPRFPYARHSLCALYKQDDNITCNVVHTFRGGNTQRQLTRTCFLSNKSDYAAAYIEDQRIVSLWNVNNGNKVGSVPAKESVLDLNSVRTARADFLLTLTETKLRFFKFTS